MRIISFVEGALKSRGGIGIPSVVTMGYNLSLLDNEVVLINSGQPIYGSQNWINPLPVKKFKSENGYLISQYPSLDHTWCFNPWLFTDSVQLAQETDFILLHSLYSFPVLAGYILARKNKKPYFIFLHGVLAPFQRTVSHKKKAVYDWLIARNILNNASAIIFTSAGERNETRSLRLSSKSIVIPLGINYDEFSQLPKRGGFRLKNSIENQRPIVLFLGRLNVKKGLDILIRAMKGVVDKIPDAILVIAGGSDPESYQQKIISWIHENGIENNTILTGMVVGIEKLELLVDADVLVHSSHAENFGYAVFEAMACRLPVVVSNTLNYAEEVHRQEAGFSVLRNPSNFSEAIITLLENSELRKKMGSNGLQMVKEYTWEKTSEKISRAMNSVLECRPFDPDLDPE